MGRSRCSRCGNEVRRCGEGCGQVWGMLQRLVQALEAVDMLESAAKRVWRRGGERVWMELTFPLEVDGLLPLPPHPHDCTSTKQDVTLNQQEAAAVAAHSGPSTCGPSGAAFPFHSPSLPAHSPPVFAPATRTSPTGRRS